MYISGRVFLAPTSSFTAEEWGPGGGGVLSPCPQQTASSRALTSKPPVPVLPSNTRHGTLSLAWLRWPSSHPRNGVGGRLESSWWPVQSHPFPGPAPPCDPNPLPATQRRLVLHPAPRQKSLCLKRRNWGEGAPQREPSGGLHNESEK